MSKDIHKKNLQTLKGHKKKIYIYKKQSNKYKKQSKIQKRCKKMRMKGDKKVIDEK